MNTHFLIMHCILPFLVLCRTHSIGHPSPTPSAGSRDENQLAKILAAVVAGLTLLAELVASLRKGTHQSREADAEAIAA